jgi:hypothetical protein
MAVWHERMQAAKAVDMMDNSLTPTAALPKRNVTGRCATPRAPRPVPLRYPAKWLKSTWDSAHRWMKEGAQVTSYRAIVQRLDRSIGLDVRSRHQSWSDWLARPLGTQELNLRTNVPAIGAQERWTNAPHVTITCARNNAGGVLIAATREEADALNSGQEWILSGSSG